ncbi:BatD family protein [Endozoicomonas sp. Mp262]|uniref:BatD family protein n=1 Tax=Endozoicomonas sp. Mp262 TaxID=2919499 RepID=UPI0021DA3E3D
MEIIQNTALYRTFLVTLLYMLVVFSQPSFATFSASVDHSVIGSHETFELNLRSDTDSASAPDLSKLEKDFDVLGTRQSRQVRIINGRSESWRDWIITLAPKRTGSLTIPAISLGSEQSSPVTITVSGTLNQPGTTSNVSPVFMRAELDTEQVYIQQEVVLTLKIFHRVNLYDDSRLSPLEIEDAIVQQLGDTKKYESVIDGTRYGIFELKFAIYPQKTGSLMIPAMTFTGTMADRRAPFSGMFSMGGKPIVARSPEILLSVQEQPDDYPGHDWLPTKKLTLTESWSQSLDSIKVGDAVTRTITMQADGLNAAQLPPLNLPSPSGANSYPDQSSTEDIPTAEGIIGKRVSAIAIVPTQAGPMTLPAIKVTWFDTQRKIVRTTEIPGRTIQVQPAENYELVQPFKAAAPVETTTEQTTPVAEEEVPPQQESYWKWLALAMGLLWLITGLGGWLFWKKSRKSPLQTTNKATGKTTVVVDKTDEKSLFQQFENTCHNHEKPGMILESFKQWSRVYLNAPELATVQQCVQRFDSETLKTVCHQIDSAIYSGKTAEAEAEELLALCQKMRKNRSRKKIHEETVELYPQ